MVCSGGGELNSKFQVLPRYVRMNCGNECFFQSHTHRLKFGIRTTSNQLSIIEQVGVVLSLYHPLDVIFATKR